jgi:hypothetical protein
MEQCSIEEFVARLVLTGADILACFRCFSLQFLHPIGHYVSQDMASGMWQLLVLVDG